MSFKSGISVDNNSLKFVELKKYQISRNGVYGLSCVCVDNNRQIAFVLSDDNIVVTELNHLLNYEWNKSVVNEITEQFQHFSIGLHFRPHLISLSANGFGTKLAVCGTDGSNESPFVVFFDLNDVFKNQNKTIPYSRLNLINSSGLVSEIVWHPEVSDNQFGCCVTDGSVFVISIGDIDTKRTTILAHIPANNQAMCLCWSPKGKQLVVGHRNGFFTQYKLIEGKPLQEVKKTVLINGLNEHHVIAIKWIVSSLFAMAVTKDTANREKDTHLLLVSTPSKAQPQFVDFGAVCLDSTEVNDFYRINLVYFHHIILCSTSLASEVAIIGCDADKDISVPDNWSQWMLEDSSRIDLPIDNYGNDTQLRGIIVAKGTQNVFKLNVNESYGDIDCPILLIYNSSGILIPYLLVDRSGKMKAPIVTNIVKPTVISTPIPQNRVTTSTPIQAVSNGPQNKVLQNPSTPSFGSPFAPIVSSNTLSKPEPKPMPTNQLLKTSHSVFPQTISSEATPHESRPEKSPTPEDTTVATNELYLNAIKEQIKEFNKQWIESKKRFSKICVKIGEKEEQMEMKTKTRLLEEVLKEIENNFKNSSKDATTLQSSLIESFSLLEEAKSITDRNVDPKYRYLLKQRALDPMTARRMQEIHSLNEYIEIQLRELDAKFEQEWYEWLERRKGSKTKQLNRIQGNSSLDLIYKALANNQRVINTLKLHLNALEGLSSPLKMSPNTRSFNESFNESPNKRVVEKLSHSLNKTSIKDITCEELSNDRVFKLKTISDQKKTNLRSFFENRSKVPVRRAVDNSSRFISAIEKLKEKQKIIERNRLSLKKVESIVTETKAEDKTKSMISSTDSKVIITPTVVNVSKNVNKEVPKTKTVIEQSVDQKSPAIAKPSKSESISNANKAEMFASFQSKPLSFNLTSTPVINTSKAESTAVPTSTPKPLPPTPILSSLISTKTKPEVESTKGLSESGNKSVSFGDITVINPIENTLENDFRLDTITELSENNENSSLANSPFTSFKGFGNQSTDSPIPKLSFNLNPSLNSGFSFKLTSDSKSETNDSLPKYEDISPPTTPQKTVPLVVKSVSNESPIVTDSESTKQSIKTTISLKSVEQNENKTIDSTTVPKPTIPSTTSVDSSARIPTTTTPIQTPTPLPTTTSNNTEIISTDPKSVTTPNTESISSPFGASAFGQTPFASNSFSFGNVTPNTTAPAFNQGLSFGGQTPVTTASSAPLAFGQQTSIVNNLSFCGLGGRPSAENAQKNAFGGAFSSPPIQTTTQAFTTPTTQSSPFGVKPSSGGFGGSFTSGSGVAQTGFAAFQASPQQNQPLFGGSPVFGGTQPPAFGGSPTFGGSPQSTAFGSAPTFGGPPAMGSMTSTAFGAQNTGAFGVNNSFNTTNTGLSFGALASNAQQTPQQNTAPFGSGFSGFGSSDSFSFTQRRK